MESKTTHNARSVTDYLASLTDEQTAKDAVSLIALMQCISGQEPQLWIVGTIGFGTYRYHYDSGREGDAAPISFYPRNGKITIYLMDGTARYAEQLARVGKHTTSRVGLYIKRLCDIELPVLEHIVRESYASVTSHDGHMHRIVE